MKKIFLMAMAFVLCLSVCSCSVSWTEEDIREAHTVEITWYNPESGNIQVIYTITDEKTVENLCNTFSILALKDAHIKGQTEKSYYIRFIGNGGEIDHVSIIAGHNTLQDKHGDLYKITDEMDIERHLGEVLESAPSEIRREPEENYRVNLMTPAQNQTFDPDDAPPTFDWYVQSGLPQTFVVEIDCGNGEAYLSRTVTGIIAYALSAEDWETIKAAAPVADGVQTIRWRIRIDPVYTIL